MAKCLHFALIASVWWLVASSNEREIFPDLVHLWNQQRVREEPDVLGKLAELQSRIVLEHRHCASSCLCGRSNPINRACGLWKVWCFGEEPIKIFVNPIEESAFINQSKNETNQLTSIEATVSKLKKLNSKQSNDESPSESEKLRRSCWSGGSRSSKRSSFDEIILHQNLRNRMLFSTIQFGWRQVIAIQAVVWLI